MTHDLVPPDADGGGYQSEQGSDDANPPAYETLEALETAPSYAATPPELPPTPSFFTISSPEGPTSGPTEQQPFRSYDWETSPSGPAWGKLSLSMVPDHHSEGSLPWLADLVVCCWDLARLMREGFFWSHANIVPEEGYMSNKLEPDMAAVGFQFQRIWRLVDRQQHAGGPPLWIGWLTVHFADLGSLAAFRIQDLSAENIERFWASNAQDNLVYAFCHAEPEHAFNCIYDDMPMEGWWPYPKVATDGETDRAEENGEEEGVL